MYIERERLLNIIRGDICFIVSPTSWIKTSIACTARILGLRGGRGASLLCFVSRANPHFKKTHIIARNHYSQLASHEGRLSRCALNLSWAIMGHHGLFLSTD